MMVVRYAFVLVCCLLAGNTAAIADDEQAQDTSRVDALVKAAEAEDADSNGPEGLRPPVITAGEYLDERGRDALTTSVRTYYEYKTTAFNHRQRVFEWQLLSSKIIFVVVILLVLIGIYFSWLQFKADMARGRPGRTGEEQSAGAASAPATSSIEASTTGIKVSSPVLGVIILVISLMFFYLYLQYVYPIEELL